MALPSSALWEGRPLTEKRLYVSYALMEAAPTVAEDQNLEEAVRQLGWTEGSGLPVLTPDGARAVGWLTHRDVLRAYNDHLPVADRRSSFRKADHG